MVGVCRGGPLAWLLLVLVLGAACVWVVGGSWRAYLPTYHAESRLCQCTTQKD